jgi:hypothetical protein
MARIPKFRGQVQTSSQVPRVELSPNAIGATETAMANIGGEIGNFALEIVKQRTQREADEYSSKGIRDYNSKREAYKVEITRAGKMSRDGILLDDRGLKTGVTYDQAMQKWDDDYFQGAKDNAPTTLAETMLTSRLLKKQQINKVSDENTYRGMVKLAKQEEFQFLADSGANSIMMLPIGKDDPYGVHDLQQFSYDQVSGLYEDLFIEKKYNDQFSVREQQNLFNSSAKINSDAYFKKVYSSNSPLEIEKAIDLIEKNPGSTNFDKIAGREMILAGMSSEEKATELVKLRNVQKSLKSANAARFNQDQRNILEILKNEGAESPAVRSNINNFKRNVMSSDLETKDKISVILPILSMELGIELQKKKHNTKLHR